MKIGLQTVCAADLELDEVVALAESKGLDGLELATGYLGKFRGEPDGPEWHVDTQNLLASAEKAAMLARNAGVEILSLATRCAAEDKATLESLCRAAQSIGCPHVRVGPGRYDPEIKFWGSMQRSKRALAEAIDIARRYDVKPVVELHDHTMADGVLACYELIHEFKAPDVGIIFDAGNARVHGYQPWPEALDILLEFVTHVHAKDVEWVREDGKWTSRFAGPGEGLVEWPELIGLLHERGFDGYLVIEDYRGGWCRKNPDWPAERKVTEWKGFLDSILGQL